MCSIVEPLDAAFAEQGRAHRLRRRPVPFETGLVVEERGRLRASHACRPAQQEPRLEQVRSETGAGFPDIIIRRGEEGGRAVDAAVPGKAQHGSLFARLRLPLMIALSAAPASLSTSP